MGMADQEEPSQDLARDGAQISLVEPLLQAVRNRLLSLRLSVYYLLFAAMPAKVKY